MYGTVNVHEFIYSTSMTTVFVIHYYVCQLLKEDEPRLIRTLKAL